MQASKGTQAFNTAAYDSERLILDDQVGSKLATRLGFCSFVHWPHCWCGCCMLIGPTAQAAPIIDQKPYGYIMVCKHC